MMRNFFSIAVFIFVVLYRQVTFAGECVSDLETDEDILSTIKTRLAEGVQSIDDDFWRAIYCLGAGAIGYYEMGVEYFAGPKVLENVKRKQTSLPYIIEYVPPFLNSTDHTMRCHAASVLAFYGWKPVLKSHLQCVREELDELKAEDQNSWCGIDWVPMAVMHNKRYLPLVYEYYDIVESKFKARKVSSYHATRCFMGSLNVVYHVRSKKSLPFLEKVIAKNKIAEVKKKAMMAKKYIQDTP